MLYIFAIHKNSETGVIEKLWYSNGLSTDHSDSCTKRAMINYINLHPDTVKTMYRRGSSWIPGEYVHVVDNEYLRTDANHKTEDNLGELIEY